MEERLAFFDIDKTIINGDSMILLIKYTVRKHPLALLKLPRVFKDVILYRLKLISLKEAKETMFFTLNYLNKKDLKDFYENVLLKRMYKDGLKEVREKKSKGYKVVLVSASPECYIKYFNTIEEVDFVIGTILEETKDNYINEIVGENCKGEEKVRRINKFLEENKITIDYENSFAYSDSLADIPMMNLVKNKAFINFNKRSRDKFLEYMFLNWR
ncbi:HAD-IB family hydrolase [Clostridium hydrogeniformans]|uniref:HAD-IB family hydrolase n=1 Tax=Clostridium hydrogeniformans TaxID=349933 RepID=UPI00048072E1|nr:HAD-IB family hydrolase [Clostridium hydrogeniformans]